MQRRLVQKYDVFPLRLARIVDSTVALHEKEDLSREFFRLKDCCLCARFGHPLRQQMNDELDLCPGRPCYSILKVTFQGPNCNVPVENVFARIKSSQRSTRGRSCLAHSISANHILAELKVSHEASCTRAGSLQDAAEENANCETNPLQKKNSGLLCTS